LWDSGRPEEAVSCEGLRHRIHYASNVVKIRVPSAYMGDPQSLQVAVSNSSMDENYDIAKRLYLSPQHGQ
jgi:hypothetical protein